jgi:dihydroorotate dehydrogenase electron transfer subunit
MDFNIPVVKSEKLSDDIALLRLQSEKIAATAVPGQFVNIKCGTGLEAYLRRPISICRVDLAACTFDIVYRVCGKGTRLLCDIKKGDFVDVIGPLGKGFTLPKAGERIAVVGGGIGLFPLLFLLARSVNAEKTAFIGFRSRDGVVLMDEFKNAADKLVISTDDGSFGIQGVITEGFLAWLKGNRPDRVYTCGPAVMMKIVAEACIKNGIFCEVSMEQRMGCGIGACLVCACKVKDGEDFQYKRVCKDGPVFSAERVIF